VDHAVLVLEPEGGEALAGPEIGGVRRHGQQRRDHSRPSGVPAKALRHAPNLVNSGRASKALP
jgi:hypothetical protein